MKTLFAAVLIALLTACASKPTEQTLVIDKEIQGMSRNEVIVAIQECESSGTRAVMVYSKRKISGFSADIVVDVTCAPRFKY
jgi:uncharacterized lipoprotein YmbA